MSIEITIRHIEIGDAVKAYAREKAERLAEKFPDIEFTHVVLDKDGPFFCATLTIQGGHGSTVGGEGKKADLLEALQDAFEKAETQLRKHSQRLREAQK